MANQRKKSDLPTKVCPVCDRPFTWRKKWEKCWDEVKYCSDRCRRRKQSVDKISATSYQLLLDHHLITSVISQLSSHYVC